MPQAMWEWLDASLSLADTVLMLLLPLLAVAALNTGDDLLASCIAQGPEKLLCTAMVMGVANGAAMAAAETHQRILCLRPNVRPADLIEAVRKYLDAHPEERSRYAPALTYRALKEALPCPGS